MRTWSSAAPFSARSETIDADDLPPEIKDEEAQFKSAVDLLPSKLNLAETMDKIEGALVKRALVRAEFVQVKAAEMLGLSKSNLQYKLKNTSLQEKRNKCFFSIIPMFPSF